MAAHTTNPLLNYQGFPPFDQMKAEYFYPAVQQVIAENKTELSNFLHQNHTFSWSNLMVMLEHQADRLQRVWGPVEHLVSVMSTEDYRHAYQQGIVAVSDYYSEMSQNEVLYEAVQQLVSSQEFAQLSEAKQKVLHNELRDFRLSGVHLAAEQKNRYREIRSQLEQLMHRFEENLLLATDAFSKHIEDEALLAGLPEDVKTMAKHNAEKKDLAGFLLTLEAPCYLAVMMHADHAALRQEMYQAYVTRASELADPKLDNTKVMSDILILRDELAKILGFDNYAQYALATRMAKECPQVIQFLTDLADRAKPYAHAEFQQLEAFARQRYGVTALNPWDIAYYSEKLREQSYDFSQEDLRPYFPEAKVVSGLFQFVQQLYQVSFEEIPNSAVWNDDVRLFAVNDRDGSVRGYFYLDLYARAQKRSGAWVGDCLNLREIQPGKFQRPVVYVICNFPGPVGDKPALWNFTEVETLFHEFGHALHHMLTKVDASFVAGTHGVAWDAVELPSQFMENWCYEKSILDMISGHYQTNAPISDELFAKIHKAKNFQSGMQTVRQLIYSLFDFRLHMECATKHTPQAIQQVLNDIRAQYTVEPVVPFNRFQHSFSHIFAGGYAAGYYSYKWAEVLSSDAYARFEEEGLHNPKVAQDFLHEILERGGEREPEELFRAFRGRDPSIEALLRHSGLAG